ncbi:uncharacterized protein LOC122503563 [Leptopilina heterotoma]|uniref:uncharacterized protein LOC122503563 n=1 Tax=Leptopilina heterotoma TaxID=63436 RepID=UPI001CA9EA3F|nr:uncharacterized protein LOC122503563 [Leptopilina heterotoma]XP_043470079.1 uncharacterized protein LOC122503563 [Leptopilina heterotoma]
MDNSLVKKSDSSTLQMPLLQPLSIPSVTLHLEATRYFSNRILSVSFTEENGWCVKEIEIPLEALNNFKKQEDNKAPSRISRSGRRQSTSTDSKSDIEDVKVKKNEKFKDIKDIKKLMKLKYLLFGTTSDELAPKSYTVMLNGKEKRYHCIECSFNYQTAVRVAEHFYTEHNPGTNFKCPYCSNGFKLRNTLKIHLITVCKIIPVADRANILNTTKKNFLQTDV